MPRDYPDMTPKALACRADEIAELDPVYVYIGGDDERVVTAFFRHDDCELDGDTPDGFTVPGFTRHLIGATLDDADVLTRDEVRAMFGDETVTAWEDDAFEVEA
jgi:hypothetical protein